MSDPLKFHCDFGRGVTATIIFDVDEYRRGNMPGRAQRIEWTGQPTKEIIPRYLDWMHAVNTEIAKAINGKYLYVGQKSPDPNDWEIWMYYPDGKRERLPFPPK